MEGVELGGWKPLEGVELVGWKPLEGVELGGGGGGGGGGARGVGGARGLEQQGKGKLTTSQHLWPPALAGLSPRAVIIRVAVLTVLIPF